MNSVLKHYDKAIMIVHQFAMDEYFLYEVLFHHFRKKKGGEGGGEDKKRNIFSENNCISSSEKCSL